MAKNEEKQFNWPLKPIFPLIPSTYVPKNLISGTYLIHHIVIMLDNLSLYYYNYMLFSSLKIAKWPKGPFSPSVLQNLKITFIIKYERDGCKISEIEHCVLQQEKYFYFLQFLKIEKLTIVLFCVFKCLWYIKGQKIINLTTLMSG